MSVTPYPILRLKLPGSGGSGVSPHPTLKLTLTAPPSLNLEFLPAIPGSNIHGKVNRSGDTMGGSLILDHDPVIPLEAATKQYVDFVGASGVTPGDKGDITIGGGGTWTIDNDAVTYAKMQNVSAASLLLGRGSASGAGDVQEIVLGSNLIMSGTTLNASGGTSIAAPPTTDNAIVRWDGATGTLIQNSSATISDDGRLDLRPTEETLTQGLNIRNVPVGDQAGLTTYCNRVLIAADKSDGSDPGSNLVGFGVDHVVGPAVYTGNSGPRAAGSFLLFRMAPSTGGSGQDVGLGMSYQSNASGLGPTPQNMAAYAAYSSVQLQNGATDYAVANSFQMGVGVETGASSEIIQVLRLGHNPAHAVTATSYESALDFVDDITATVGWDALITSTNKGGKYPLKPGGTFIRTLHDTFTQTFANGIDFSDANITNMLMQGKGFIGLMGSTSGTVKLKTAAAAGTWDMTLPTTAGTPGYFLQTNGSGVTTWAAGGSGGSGDVVGPAPATDNAVVRFDGTTGKLIQNSNVLVADTGATSWAHTGSFRGLDQQQTLPLTGTAPDHQSGYDGHNVYRITQDALRMTGGLGVSKGWTFTHEWGGANATSAQTTVTITIASPAVVSWVAHGLIATDTVVFTTTGALPTGLVAGTTYYVAVAGLGANSFQVSATLGGAAINTSGAQSGVHTATAGTLTGRIAMAVTAYQTGATTFVPGYQSSITEGMQIASISIVSSGGTGFGVNASGNVVGANIVTGLAGSATFYRGLLGMEIDVGTATGCSSDDRNGLFIGGGGPPGNSDFDCAIGIHGAPNPDAPGDLHGWKTAILFYDPLDVDHGSITPTGYVMRAINQDNNTIGGGIDLSGFGTITGNAWKSQGAQIDGTGAFLFSSPSPNFIVTTNTTPLIINTVGAGNTAPRLDNATPGRATVWEYNDANVPKWYVGKAADNSYAVLDASTVHTVLSSALGSDAVRLGTVGTNGGKLLFSGSASGTVGVQVASGAGTWDMTLPTTAGTSGYFLQTNGSGVTTWAAAPGAGSGSPGGATTHVQFNTAGVFDGDDEFTYDSAGAITLGKATGGSGTIKLKGSTSGTVTVEPAPVAGTWTLRLPVDDGDAGEVLTTDGGGITSWAAAGSGREIVTAARTYHVNNVTGNDADDGLTTGNAFATIGKAVNVVCDDIYWVNITPTISVAKTGVNYNEFVVLRPWQGNSASDFSNVASITGDPTDWSHLTGVFVKPVGGTFERAVVVCTGQGARWTWVYISVDGSATAGAGCYFAGGGAYLGVGPGDLGLGNGGSSQFMAVEGSTINWNNDYSYPSHVAIPSHVFGAGGAGSQNLLTAYTGSHIGIDGEIEFDDDPGYWVVFWADQNSFFQLYHNTVFSGVHPTGQRILLRENSRGNTRVPLASLPGDSWDSTGYQYAVDETSTWNCHGPTFKTTYSDIAVSLSGALLVGSTITITDSNTNTPGDAVASGGGAFTVPLWYTGSGWVVLAPVSGGAGVTDGDKGDVVVSSSGTVWTIDSDVVSYSKMQNVSAASKLLGRGASGAGDPEEITLGTGLSMSGTTLNSSGGSGSLTIGTSPITGGTTTRVLYDLAGVLQEAANFTISSGNPNVVSGGAYYYNGFTAFRADTALNNWFGGPAGNLTATGGGNVATGNGALVSLTSGSSNLAIGNGALALNTSAAGNVGLGANALGRTTTGGSNLALGNSALYNNTTGVSSVAIGDNASAGAASGIINGNNVAIGASTISGVSSGQYNVALGPFTMSSLTTGSHNMAIGSSALNTVSTTDANVGIGSFAMYQTTGSSNIGIGQYSGFDVGAASNNTIIGWNTGRGIATGSNNTVIGAGVGSLSASLASNVIIANGGGTIVLQYDGVNILALKDSIELTEMTAPSAPASNKARVFTQDNGSGKTQICVRFPTGATQVLATEP